MLQRIIVPLDERPQANAVPPLEAAADVDWESPAGREEAPLARLLLPAHVYAGPGETHWIGQRCSVLDSSISDDETRLVVLTCGCRARAATSAIRPANSAL